MILEKVFSRFEDEFREFCQSESIPYAETISDETASFLLYYMRRASSLLSTANGTFMQTFVRWLEMQPGIELRQRNFDAATLYATAFEFTIAGAEALS